MTEIRFKDRSHLSDVIKTPVWNVEWNQEAQSDVECRSALRRPHHIQDGNGHSRKHRKLPGKKRET